MFGFSMSKEQKMVSREVSKLVKGLVADSAHEMDENREIPADVIQKAWELGASVSSVPEEFGGHGMEDSPVESTIVLEELAYGDMAFAVAATTPSLFINPLVSMGTEEQKKSYLPLYCREDYTPATLALNEPHFGADVMNLKTTALKKGGSYVLNGTKCFVPMADKAGHMMVAASIDGVGNLFIVSMDNPGVAVGEREKNLGCYALPTFEITLTECVVPETDRLGGENGCDYVKFIQKTRVGMAAMAAGIARASYEFAKDYAKGRVQFGEPIVNRQSIAFMLAEMAYEVDSIRLLAQKAASELAAGKDVSRSSYLAKMYAGEMAMKVTDYGVQILGGHGYIREYPVERYYRNARGISILEGMAIV
jgi:alkylation response protein AidB-like acyl-CoA dehydrogenase